MKTRQDNATRFSALRITLSVAAVLLAFSFKAAPAASEPGAAIVPPLRSGGGVGTFNKSINTVRYDHTATLLPNGKVLVAGRYNSSGFLSGVELYESEGGLCTICHKHTATLSLT